MSPAFKFYFNLIFGKIENNFNILLFYFFSSRNLDDEKLCNLKKKKRKLLRVLLILAQQNLTNKKASRRNFIEFKNKNRKLKKKIHTNLKFQKFLVQFSLLFER